MNLLTWEGFYARWAEYVGEGFNHYWAFQKTKAERDKQAGTDKIVRITTYNSFKNKISKK